MAGFVRYKGSSKEMRRYPSKASTAFAVGDAVVLNSATGQIDPYATNGFLLGIVQEAKSASDATTTPLLVDVVRDGEEFINDSATGTMTAAKVGLRCDIATANTVALGTVTNNDATVTGWDGSTATKVICKFNKTVFGA